MITVNLPRFPDPQYNRDVPNLFLAGTIDMGRSADWQSTIIDMIRQSNVDINIFNPRRPGFQTFNKSEQQYQITWELDALMSADYVLIYFSDNSLSPVSLLELGFLLPTHDNDKLFVVANDTYARWDNILLTCQRFNVVPYENLRSGIDALIEKIKMRNL